MAHYVALQYDNQTLDLTTGDNLLGQYSIQPARMGNNGAYEYVSERIQVHVNGSSANDLQSNMHAIERLLSTAGERRAVGEGAKLYLLVKPDGYSDVYRAEIISAVFNPDRATLATWPNYLITGHIEFVRSPYFEGPRKQLSLSNRHGSGTGWITIDNRNDGSHDAFVDIGAGAIDGTLPAPLEVQIKNDQGSAVSWGNFFIGVNARSNPTEIEPILEGEAQTGGGGSVVSDSSASSGSVWRTASTPANVHLFPKWTIPSTWADAFRGRFVHVLVYLGQAFTADWIYRAKIMDAYGLIDLFVGYPRQANDDYIFLDLGVLPIPPTAYASNLAELKLAIEMYHTESGSHQQSIDYILLLPTDSGRTITQTGMQINPGDYAVFDEIERVWVSDESGERHPIYTPRGPGVLAYPNTANRIWLVADGYGVSASDKKSVKAYYRARRLTL